MSDLFDLKRLMIDLIALPIIDRAPEDAIDPMETRGQEFSVKTEY